MAVRTGIIYSAKHPLPKKKNFFEWLGKVLEVLGKPLFWAILVIGYLLLVISSRFAFYVSRLRLPKIRLPKIVLPRPRITKKFLIFVFVIFTFSFLLFIFYSQILKDLPSPDRLITRDQIVSTKIYDRSGKLLYKIYRSQNRTLVKLEDIPLPLRQATIAIEDAEFYSHHGLSAKGILRAFGKLVRERKVEGGSTITQQLVKNTLLTPERTIRRKIKEIILALWVEQKFSKDEILQMYLNEVGFGGAAYGVEETSETYFGKSVKEINLAEASLLAGLPASPTTYSPFGAHPEKARERQKQVLRRMVEEKFITQRKADEVFSQDLRLVLKKTDIFAPHFVMYVKELLVKKYGERMVEEGGLEVSTSLDFDLQEMTQKKVTEEVQRLQNLHISNGAALVTNPKTGEILAMVGSKDYFDLKNQGNYNVSTALRQPGSSIKPVNYSVALSMGFTPATIIPDTPITYHVPGQPPYTPKNYDGRFHGNVPLRVALGSSYNVPAVKVLSSLGVSRMIEQGRKMGITNWNDPSQYGLSLTLGGGEVKMTDMAVVYGTLANLGVKVDLHPILEVRDYKGKVLEKLECSGTRGEALLNERALEPAVRRGVSEVRQPADRRTLAFASDVNTAPDLSVSCKGEPVLNPQIAYILTDILSDNSARTPAFGPNSLLNIPGHPSVAVKTGTTQNLRDNWAIGYTPDFVVVSWVGNNDNSPMGYVASGVTGATPIWHNIMKELLKDKPDEKFSLPASPALSADRPQGGPENLVKVEICSLTGTLSCDACPSKKWEIFLPGTEPKKSCNEEEIKKILEERNQH
ncbi:MAG: transglycosylase domain-containing protein [Patescibacteria group bacterium]